MSSATTPQSQAVRARLERGWLTPLEALRELGCFRLGARVFDLRRAGIPVIDESVVGEDGKRWKRYRIVRGGGR